jgi:recA bacterial DNA recombination protein
MSSAVVSTSAALGRPFVFDDKAVPEVPPPTQPSEGRPPQRVRTDLSGATADPRLAHVTSASRLDIRPAPEMVSSGIPAIDALTGGLPRGCLTEICGPASSGRTSLLLAALASATSRGEFCAVVDASDALDPHSAVAAGIELERLLWVRCGEKTTSKNRSIGPISRASLAREVGKSQTAFNFDRTRLNENGSRQSDHCLEQVLRATDLLLESGGFGLIVLDLGDLPQQAARRIPLTTWFRFRRAVENKPTILLAIEQHPIAGSCSSLLVQLGASDSTVDESAAERRQNAAHGASRGLAAGNEQAPEGRKTIHLPAPSELDFPCPTHAQLFTGLDITAELTRSRLDRKPARSIAFETKTAWAG